MKKTIISLSLILALSAYFVGCKKKDLPENQPTKKAPDKTSIIGGQQTNISSVPYQCAVFVEKDGIPYYGGGVILSENWILTAAHVVTHNDAQIAVNKVTVGTGSSTLNNSISVNVDQIIRHSGYSGQSNDIALIHLSTPIVFNANTAPINYETNPNNISVNALAEVSGWGAIAHNSSTGTSTGTNDLFAVEVKVSSIEPAIIRTLSTTSAQQAPCYGDSGGPLTAFTPAGERVLIGVVNGWGDCNVGAKGYARVSTFASWIYANSGVGSDRLYGNYGLNYFCGSTNFNIVEPSTGSTVNWSVSSSSNATLSASTGNSVTLTRTGNLYADLNLTATITFPGGRTKVINKALFSDCKIPIVVEARRGARPTALIGGVKFISNNWLNPREFSFDWTSLGDSEIVPGTYSLYAYLDNGVSASVNVNGTSQNVTGQGLNSVGIGSGILLGTVTVSSGFYVKAILP
ncbi:serine protease [Pedobacter frigoris]|uniref:serine protease n=1 Tax=Pedobacter frigoris TaxID=2571272 RepID=UPI002930C5F9|nr:serine protease [Pedobacter frigoris]